MEEKAIELLGFAGIMISGSKSGYYNRNPKNLAVFNSNLIVMEPTPTKIWYGDIDLTLSLDKLKELAEAIGQEIRVLREMDARFKCEDEPRVEAYVVRVEPNGNYELGQIESTYYSHEDLTKK
jgi:hypothetical protein